MKTYSSLLSILALALTGIVACTPSNPNVKPASLTGDPNMVVAKIGDAKITNKELEEFAKPQLTTLEQEYQKQVYQEKRQALEGLVNKTLVEKKAKAAGKSADKLLEEEVFAKVTEPTDEEVKVTYDQAKAAGQQLPPLDEIKKNITQFLKQQKVQGNSTAYYTQLRAEAKVEILLPVYRAPRVDVSSAGPSKGPKDAKVTIVEFSDFQCPACSSGERLVNEVMKAYPESVKIVYRDFPLNIHPNAPKAAEAAHCADDQGKYWDMHAKLFENQRALEVEKIKTYAKDLGLDQAKFDKCLDSGEKKKLVDAGLAEGTKLNLTGTPSFFVNGIPLMLEGANPLNSFKDLINEELKKK